MKHLLATLAFMFFACCTTRSASAEEMKDACDTVRPGLRFSAIARQHPDWIGRKMPKEEIESLWQIACRTVLSEDSSLEINIKANGPEKKTVRLVRNRATNFLFELVTQAWKPVDEVASLNQVRLSPIPPSGTSLPTPKR
ncbi:MAG: hypothetical protein AAB886_02155 [Patescibacteria group bacterium]